ncbi:MAG: hypothetical protein BWY99_01615 [Synergistetes bacterium ADurb.BinA166]|nr:MAG: hypothetical protein BWY99_01615 [Synergistetes bacterium ADurb.BinA166]
MRPNGYRAEADEGMETVVDPSLFWSGMTDPSPSGVLVTRPFFGAVTPEPVKLEPDPNPRAVQIPGVTSDTVTDAESPRVCAAPFALTILSLPPSLEAMGYVTPRAETAALMRAAALAVVRTGTPPSVTMSPAWMTTGIGRPKFAPGIVTLKEFVTATVKGPDPPKRMPGQVRSAPPTAPVTVDPRRDVRAPPEKVWDVPPPRTSPP